MPGYSSYENWQAQDNLAAAALRQFWTVQVSPDGAWCFTPNGRDWIVTPLNDLRDLVNTVNAMTPFGFSLESPQAPPVRSDLLVVAVQAARQGWEARRHKADRGNLWSFRWGSATEIKRRVESPADLAQLRDMLEAAGLAQASPAGEVPVTPLRSVRRTPGRTRSRQGPQPWPPSSRTRKR